MGSSDFYIDYNIDVPEVGDDFDRETERRLQELASRHSDLVGAAVSLEKVADTTTYDVHRVRIVVYKRPRDIVVTKQDADPLVALRDAGDSLPAAAVCLSPWVDLEGLGESMITRAEVDPMIQRHSSKLIANSNLPNIILPNIF